MDVELQILKHLARDAHPTVAIVDEYCAEYKGLPKNKFSRPKSFAIAKKE
ncbi:hypothetical protein [Nostoc commune]|nr:hypothetical protein [Nostoc commune]